MREATRDAAVGQRHAKLAGVLAKWVERGADGDTFRVEGFEIRPGDWLLMRNPSPYNRFTDLSPGLFTHVGVVATETDVQGVRRFVIVDLPERGDRIPATNVDAYLPRTLHYIFLRHETPNVGKRMGEVAASLIGRESLFDLSFRTDRIAPLRGKLDEAATVQTYCAGFLLLCAQETRAPREEFFPIRERVADGHCSANLAKLGLSIGTDFVSPTAAIFSPRLQIVGRREPMYTPDREIKEAIYDHFADCMVTRELQSSPNVLQWLREKLAHTAAEQPWLARAMARAHGVNERMDLESASKAAAVIETLDEIADRNMNEFLAARQALLAEPAEQAAAGGDSQRAAIDKYRIRHRELLRRWQDGQLTPRLLRIALVDFYARQGKAQVDERFFPQQNP
jgi:hypothetical protein